jgi:uncharacterized protein (DUF697 family)
MLGVSVKTINTESMGETTMDENMKKDAEKIITQHVAWSVGAGLVPFPILDVLAVTVIQLDMLKQLCRVHDVSYSESSGKALLSAVTGGTLARLGASMVKALPGVGTALGMVSMPILSGASTYAIGHAAILHFETGGDLFDIDFSKIKEMYEEFFKTGKKVAQQVQKRQAKSSKSDVLKRLEELVTMKEQGIITEEEFEQKKQQLLDEL